MSALKDIIEKQKPERQSMLQLLLPSIIGMLLCAVSLAGLSFAWFTASTATPAQTITAASFSVAAEVKGENASVKTNSQGVITISFTKAGTYDVTLAAGGTGSGYCEIALDGEKKITGNLRGAEKDKFTFQVILETDASITCTVTPWWRPYDGVVDPATSGVVFTCAKASAIPEAPASSGEETKTEPEGEKTSTEPVVTTPAVTEAVPESTKPSDDEPAPATPVTSTEAEDSAPADQD